MSWTPPAFLPYRLPTVAMAKAEVAMAMMVPASAVLDPVLAMVVVCANGGRSVGRGGDGSSARAPFDVKSDTLVEE